MTKNINGESGQTDANLETDSVEAQANERRVAVKKILAGSAITTGAVATSKTWVKPVVDATFLPAHAQMSEVMEEEPLQRDTYSLSACDVCGGPFQSVGVSVSGAVTPADSGVTVMITYTLTRVGTLVDNTGMNVGTTPVDTLIEITVPGMTDANGDFLEEMVTAADLVDILNADYLDESVDPPVTMSGLPAWKSTMTGYFRGVNFSGGYTMTSSIAFSDSPDMSEETCSINILTGAPCLATQ